jgi:hypothetical protein
MAKRKRTDIVQLKLRLREELRRKIDDDADAREISLNMELNRRLEWSFQQEKFKALIDLLTGSQRDSLLLLVIATALRFARNENALKAAEQGSAKFMATVIRKIVETYLGEKRPIALDDFPDRDIKGSSDNLALRSLRANEGDWVYLEGEPK